MKDPGAEASSDLSGSGLARQAALLTLGIWGLDVLLYVLPIAAAGRAILPGGAAGMALYGGLGLLLSSLVFIAGVRAQRRGRAARFLDLAPAVLLVSLALTACDLVLGGWLRQTLDGAHPDGRMIAARGVSQFLMAAWMFALLGALYLMMMATRTVRERERQLAEARAAALAAEAQASAARLAALRYQLNPHFLFNTLNAVSSSVITGRNAEAESMLARLADFLRLTLAADPEAMIPLEDELAALQVYLEIESERFRDRLGVEFSCPDDLRAAEVPGFILQPLVENAIKHGVARTSRPVTIRFEAVRDGEDLVLIVEDDGGAAPGAADGTGVGLRNVAQRLSVLYGQRGVLRTTAGETGFQAVIRMPLRTTALRSRAA